MNNALLQRSALLSILFGAASATAIGCGDTSSSTDVDTTTGGTAGDLGGAGGSETGGSNTGSTTAGGGPGGGGSGGGGAGGAGGSTGGAQGTGASDTGGAQGTGASDTGGAGVGGVGPGGAGGAGPDDLPAHCTNGTQGDGEEGIDCGFEACGLPCLTKTTCSKNADCDTNKCFEGQCAAPLSGVHAGNLTLSKGQYPYVLTSDVQVGGLLTIEPGVTIFTEAGSRIRTFGNMQAIGDANSPITLVNVGFELNGDNQNPPSIAYQFIDCYACKLLSYDGGYLSLSLKDSRITRAEYLYIWYPVGTTYIERNVFLNTGGLSVGVSSGDAPSEVHITNNYFENVTPPEEEPAIISVWSAASDAPVTASYNTFADMGSPAVGLHYDATNFTAQGNYWSTTNPTIVESMIYDNMDDLGLDDSIAYEPILTQPDSNTPTP